ncbi:glycosyl hydrolase family 76-domain-containing protein [Whalleya microplaca]|nr:glycosyl hydrolase family 76-domain-containing protein [Whalleya microplaca]
MWHSWRNAVLTTASLLIASRLVRTYDLDVQSTDSIKDISKQMAEDLVSFYTGDQPGHVPGLLPDPYYWWEGGAFLGALIDYWYYTGDSQYNNLTIRGLLHQVGPDNDYMPPNQTLTEGNDDQGFWGMAVMTAAEYNFPNPPADAPQWLALAQAVFNTQAARWDRRECNGGLRWQIFQWNNGYDYKNSISQACFFNLAARLALYTGNQTYADWAVSTWDWMVGVRFLDDEYRILDGAHTGDNCTVVTPYEFSYNVGAFLLGSAAMVAYADNENRSDDAATWHERVDGLLNSTEAIFFLGNSTADRVMIEVACEPVDLCDVDQQSFKAYLSRWMAATTKWAPWTFARIKTLLQNSALAAARQCTGGDNHRLCGLKWANNSGKWDGTTGIGQQMAAMEVVLANMIQAADPPVTNATGGTSTGNPGAGGSDSGRVDPVGWHYGTISSGDRAGAAIVTVIILISLLTGLVFMVTDETKSTGQNWDGFRSTFSPSSSAYSSSTPPSGAAAPVLVRKGRVAVMDEKGKAIAVSDGSSSGTPEGGLFPALDGGVVELPSLAARVRHAERRMGILKPPSVVVAPAGRSEPTTTTTTTGSSRDRRREQRLSASGDIGPRSSVLRKQKHLWELGRLE